MIKVGQVRNGTDMLWAASQECVLRRVVWAVCMESPMLPHAKQLPAAERNGYEWADDISSHTRRVCQ